MALHFVLVMKLTCGIWIVDFSHNMSGDRRKFDYNSVRVEFEGSETARVLGSGKANLGEKRTNEEDVSLIKGLKNNILSVRQMVDGGKEVIFDSKGWIIRKEGSKRVITRGFKTPEIVYVLKGRVKIKKRPREYSSSSDSE